MNGHSSISFEPENLVLWFPKFAGVNTFQSCGEDTIKLFSPVCLMFIVGLSTTSSNVSMSPFFETSLNLFNAFAWILSIVSFWFIQEIPEIIIFVIIRSSRTWIVDIQIVRAVIIGIVSKLSLFLINILNCMIFDIIVSISIISWATMLFIFIVKSASFSSLRCFF